MAGHGIPHNFRHVNGYGVHTFRLVRADGASKLVKFHWKSLQGVAAKMWEEAQAAAGKNIDYMRQDLFNNIAAGRYPEWEVRQCFYPCNYMSHAKPLVAWCTNHGRVADVGVWF
jgi:catalase